MQEPSSRVGTPPLQLHVPSAPSSSFWPSPPAHAASPGRHVASTRVVVQAQPVAAVPVPLCIDPQGTPRGSTASQSYDAVAALMQMPMKRFPEPSWMPLSRSETEQTSLVAGAGEPGAHEGGAGGSEHSISPYTEQTCVPEQPGDGPGDTSPLHAPQPKLPRQSQQERHNATERKRVAKLKEAYMALDQTVRSRPEITAAMLLARGEGACAAAGRKRGRQEEGAAGTTASHLDILKDATSAVRGLYALIDDLERRNRELEAAREPKA